MFKLLPVIAGKEFPTETYNNSNEVLARLIEIAPIHQKEMIHSQHNWEEDEREAQVGYSAELQRDDTKYVLITHISELGWILMFSGDGPLRISRGELNTDELVTFLHPEWLEFEANELMSPETAIRVVSRWLLDGCVEEKDLL